MSIQISELWDFQKPALSEQRFRAALETATGDDALILQTQIARTYGLRRDFDQARAILSGLASQIPGAGAEARVRYYLELGRSYASTTHPPETQTSEALEQARAAYLQAFEIARDSQLDNLAIDALHMMTVVDTAPGDQLAWNQQALDYMEASSQPDAKKWEGSLLNNTGYALHLLGRYDEALEKFEQALDVQERKGKPHTIRIAHWMIAWTLRALGRLEEALKIQLRLERENDAAGEPDPYVFEELEHLYRALNKTAQAEHYAARRKASL